MKFLPVAFLVVSGFACREERHPSPIEPLHARKTSEVQTDVPEVRAVSVERDKFGSLPSRLPWTTRDVSGPSATCKITLESLDDLFTKDMRACNSFYKRG